MRATHVLLSKRLIIAVCAVALLAPAAATASPPQPVVFSLEMAFTGPDSAAGTFAATGVVADGGTAVQEHFIAGRTAHGVKTLVGSKGNIVIRFQGVITPTSATTATVEGRWAIVGGTGAYESLHGQGTVVTAIDFVSGELAATYSGGAHHDPS